MPAQTTVRTRAREVEAAQVRYGDRGHDVHVWTFGRHAAATTEPFGPPWWEQLPELRLGTDRFEIGGAPGSLDSWDGLGRWYGGLARGRQQLPPAAHAQVLALLEGAETEREKARRLYRHLQQTTRYVSVQLGLGGWQPYDAAYVFERRYGDCKALTNYMQALLAFAGIDSDPVLIEAGDDGTDLDPDFPDNVFNHVILRLPMKTESLDTGDAVWLECTSPYAAFGHLGSFTEGPARPARRRRRRGGWSRRRRARRRRTGPRARPRSASTSAAAPAPTWSGRWRASPAPTRSRPWTARPRPSAATCSAG